MSTSTSKPETDIILNRANVALARSQRLVASWLPPQTAEESSTIPKTEEELRREEEEIFIAVPETYVPLSPDYIQGQFYMYTKIGPG